MWKLVKMSGSKPWLVLCLLTLINVLRSDAHVHGNNGSVSENEETPISGNYNIIMPPNCSVNFNKTDIGAYQKLAAENGRLVYVHFRFQNHSGSLLREMDGDLFEPLTWVRILSPQGKRLLQLLYQYEALSLTTMGIGVEHIDMKLTETHEGCMVNQQMGALETLFRENLLTDFKHPQSDRNSSEQTHKDSISVCHMKIGKDEEMARFYYVCCQKDENGISVCSELKDDEWIEILKYFTIIVYVVAIFYCPLLIPQSLYCEKTGRVAFEQEMTSPQYLRLYKTSEPNNFREKMKIIPKRLVKRYMNVFWKTIDSIDYDIPYKCLLTKTRFNVKHRDLITENDVPVGILSTVYNSFARCEIRHIRSLLGCCTANIFGRFQPCGYTQQWHECLSKLMTSVVLLLLSVPWIIRVVFYVRYERDHYEGRSRAAEERDMHAPYQGNLILLLTPVHAVFIFSYFIVILEGLCFGIIQKSIKKHVSTILRNCFKDMRDSARVDVIEKSLQVLLFPCTKCGLFGCLLFPLYGIFVLPIVLLVVLYYYLPTVNLTCRLVGNLLWYMNPVNECKVRTKELAKSTIDFTDRGDAREIRKGSTCRAKALHVLATVFCLIALYSLVFLVVEGIQFFVQMLMYVLIGTVLNSSHVMQYIPMLFMLAVYGSSTFGSVHKKYLHFNKTLHKHVLKIFNSNNEDSLLNAERNTAFHVKTEITSEEDEKASVFINNGKLVFKSRQTVLYVDKRGTPYLRKEFFFQCCEMDHYAAPGRLFSHLVNAVIKFAAIIIFLMFVALVVIAFSEDLQLTPTNQTLVTLAGGLIPFVLTNFLFCKAELVNIEDDVRFIRGVCKLISEFTEVLPVTDIDCVPIPEVSIQNGKPVLSVNGCEVVNDESETQRNHEEMNVESDTDSDERTHDGETSPTEHITENKDEESVKVDSDKKMLTTAGNHDQTLDYDLVIDMRGDKSLKKAISTFFYV